MTTSTRLHFVARMANETRALGGNDEDKFVNGNEVLEALLNSEILNNLAEVRDDFLDFAQRKPADL